MKTLYEMMYGHKPTVSYFRAFGCPCIVLYLEHKPEFDSKADDYYFVGYVGHTAYPVYNKAIKKIVESSNVRWLEENAMDARVGPDWIFDYATLFKLFMVVSKSSVGPSSGSYGAEEDEEKEVILFGPIKPSI